MEGPMRLVTLLYELARGHAILSGRKHLTEDDLPVVIAVALSSVPDDRRRVLNLIIDPAHPDKESKRGSVTSTEIENILKFSKPFAILTIETLAQLGVGKLSGGAGPVPLTFTLRGDFGWLLTDDFLKHHQVWKSVTRKADDVPF